MKVWPLVLVVLLAAVVFGGVAKPNRDNHLTELSNIQLLVPVSLKDISQRSNPRGKLHTQHYQTKGYRDRDEHYSSIPAYAFKFDHQMQVPQKQASYLEAWAEDSGEVQKNHKRIDKEDLRKTTQYACTSLQHLPQGSVGELLLALCVKLIDELASFCETCHALDYSNVHIHGTI